MDTVIQSFSTFLNGVSDAFFVQYYDSSPNGFRCAILDFEAHTSDKLDVRFHKYRLFGDDMTLHNNLLKCFNERRKTSQCDAMDFVEHLVREDFFLDDGDVTLEDRRHMERLMTEYGIVDTTTFPRHVLDLFCVVRVENTLFYCYRSLVQNLGVEAMPRDVTGPVYTQADLQQCLNVKNMLDYVL